jgi:predicted DNA-binding ribbon-helix-helix protein
MNVDRLRTAAREPWSIPILEGIRMNSPVVKRSIVVAGAKTSITLEEEFWSGLREIARRRNIKLTEIMGEIDRERQNSNLSSATRVYVLRFFRTRV